MPDDLIVLYTHKITFVSEQRKEKKIYFHDCIPKIKAILKLNYKVIRGIYKKFVR